MQIMRVIPRKDGKFLVSLHFNSGQASDRGTNLRKVMTAEELAKKRAEIEERKQLQHEFLVQQGRADFYEANPQ